MISRMVYVTCDKCGAPASDVMNDAREARAMVPSSWVRRYSQSRGRYVDLCPKHAGRIRESVGETDGR